MKMIDYNRWTHNYKRESHKIGRARDSLGIQNPNNYRMAFGINLEIQNEGRAYNRELLERIKKIKD